MAKTAKMKLPKFPKNAFKAPGFVKDLTTNKYVLYLVAFLALTNVLGYMMLGKIICVLLFILIAYLTTYFTNNMVFVLIVPLFLVGFFSLCKSTDEVLEGMDGMKKGASVKRKSDNVEGVVIALDDDVMTISYNDGDEDTEEEVPVDTEEWIIAEMNMDNDADDEEEEEEEVITKKTKKSKKSKNMSMGDDDEVDSVNVDEFTTKGKKQDYVDHAATLDAAYSNLQSMLGEGGIKGLTEETQSLVKNQTQLAEAMKGMGPLLDQAQGMLKTMNLGDLGKDIGKMTNQLKGLSKDGFTSKISPLAGAPY